MKTKENNNKNFFPEPYGFIYDELIGQEQFELLALIKKAATGKLKGKKIIIKKPFHSNVITHIGIEATLNRHGVKTEKVGNVKWPWPIDEGQEKINSLFGFYDGTII